ncbi:unnamed protein product [Rodentolepis nana]|uniref:Methyltranfer_dom domain-containing protein n=1 Tax=Rodentolepis nana TaxID=102285 RepID=A0A0R3TL11_RODNA|nr:unnamed protein product [Rodentolepis nana]
MMNDLDSATICGTEIQWELLRMLIPGQRLMDIRPECGLLNDGRAFATANHSRDLYYLFNNRCEYIYHFLLHYVNNMRNSERFKENGGHISILSILNFPRMKAISAGVEEVLLMAMKIPYVEIINEPGIYALRIRDP